MLRYKRYFTYVFWYTGVTFGTLQRVLVSRTKFQLFAELDVIVTFLVIQMVYYNSHAMRDKI